MEKNIKALQNLLARYKTPQEGQTLFKALGYPTIEPLRWDLDDMPRSVQETVESFIQLVQVGDGAPFRIFHVVLGSPTLRRTDIRRFLEAYYRRYPQGENLFVFSTPNQPDDLAFVSPRRLPDPRDSAKVRLWLRTLQVQLDRPYRTDLEVLSRIRADGVTDPEEIWRCHEEAFSVQRVTEQFYQNYSRVFSEIRNHLLQTHKDNNAEWARDYAHQLLNRIMFLYFIARKGWLLGPNGQPDRSFMRHFWEAYRQTGAQDAFHREWLDVLLFEAFNNRWQNRAEYLQRFPKWLVDALSQAPFLNGGLYRRRLGLDDCLEHPVPDELFELLFERWTDGTFPGLFERYNFTVVESGRFDEEVAVDPEMLGMVYERLVNVTFESGDEAEDLRGTAGIFYTPRTEIDLMCRLALVDWLAGHLGKDHTDLLYRWGFALSEEEKEEADEEVTRAGLWEQLSDLVQGVRVCDPACGSGAFLVGMLLVLDDLQARCHRALGESETPYERRRRILQDQLYGVDVMEWAVRVAELRLWLQLVVETELHPAELHFRPLLPNLNLKLRPGDSLLQALGGLDLSPFRRGELPIPAHLKGRLTQLKGKKRRFFQGENSGLTEALLRKEEQDLFRDILDYRMQELRNSLVRKQNQLHGLSAQLSLPGIPETQTDTRQRKRLEAEIQELKARLERYQNARETLRPDQPPPFVWDMAFVEIFEDENPGFDIVIGNPPYVRQERIRDYLGRFDRAEYLRRLNESLRAIYPGFMGKTRCISGHADYYVYFYLHALSLLAEKGTFCFITSNSWLDVGFGKDLQEFFLRFGRLKMVIDNRARRSFAQADVNTVIVLAGPPERRRPLTEEEMKSHPVRFVAFRVPFEEAMSPVVFSEIEDERLYEPLAGFRVLRRPEFRAVLHDQWALYREGLTEPNDEELTPRHRSRRGRTGRTLAGMDVHPYAGNKWGGKYLRAPDIFFTILEKARGKLVRLGDIAEVRRGFTTGANEFFYLEPVGRTVKEVAELRERDPMAPVRVRNGAGWEGEIEAAWLRPVIKSPREIRTLRVRLEDLRYLVFMPPEDVREAIDQGQNPTLSRYPRAAAYIRWGETQGYHQRPTCASRRWWWDVEQVQAPILWWKSIGERYGCLLNDARAVSDQRSYSVLINPGIDPISFAAVCNTSLDRLFVETNAREMTGAYTIIELAVEQVIQKPMLDPRALIALREQLSRTFWSLSMRENKGIFQELGFPLCRERRCDHPEHPYEHVKPEALTLEQVCRASPDRFELDRVVFDVLGLTDEERLEVYRAVAQLVKDRLVKARSV